MDEKDGILVKMKDIVLQISKDFTVLKIRFYQASDTIQRCTNLIKPMAEIASQLDENKQKFLKLDSVEATIQRKAKQEKKTIYSDGKKLKEKWDAAANAEEEKKEAERIKREIEEKWSDYNKQFENLTCNGASVKINVQVKKQRVGINMNNIGQDEEQPN
uniref:Uncharacterized protein n=1 Tax=Quercus lobata TaxID=97700 RepID=A0A7N2R3C4_QUELO